MTDLTGCPCLVLDTPCMEQCSCARPEMSGGCKLCAHYGSVAQRKARAAHLSAAYAEYHERHTGEPVDHLSDRTRLDEIRVRANAATPGPWLDYDNVHGAHIIRMHDRLGGGNIASMDVRNSNGATEQDRNAAFIAHAREDIPYLLAALASRQEPAFDVNGKEDSQLVARIRFLEAKLAEGSTSLRLAAAAERLAKALTRRSLEIAAGGVTPNGEADLVVAASAIVRAALAEESEASVSPLHVETEQEAADRRFPHDMGGAVGRLAWHRDHPEKPAAPPVNESEA